MQGLGARRVRSTLLMPPPPTRPVIETKGRESEYESIRDEIVKMTDEVNAATIRSAATFRPSAIGAPYYSDGGVRVQF